VNDDATGQVPPLQVLLDAVSSPIRREILWLVWDDELAAGEIAEAFEVTAPTISAHLAALAAAGLVVRRVDGNFRRYRADREAMALVVPLLASGNERWQPADGIPETGLAESRVDRWVQVTTDVPAPPPEVFEDFVDGARYSEWLGVPVMLHDGRFSAELEWGTTVRGHYEVVAPPSLIAMRWDFEDDAIPVPGAQLVAYLRLAPTDGGTRVEVHQHAPTQEQAEFLVSAWSLVLGRLAEHHRRSSAARSMRRARRPKRDR
jgi:DNA-binding transcriptional ArsR family regulator/uncharacterized protein YndB with AHSA1/START domain